MSCRRSGCILVVVAGLALATAPPVATQQSIAATPSARSVLSALASADLARARGFWYAAEYWYAQAIATRPDQGRAYFYHGWALANLGRYEEAASEYQRAAARGYEPAFARFQAARSLARAGETEAAFAALDTAVKAGFAHFERMYHDGALLSLRNDPRWSEVFPPFEPDFAAALAEYRDDAAGAYESLRALATRFPAEGRAHYYLGRSAAAAGRNAEAVASLEAAAVLGFETPHARYFAARAAMAGGDRTTAWRLVREALASGFVDWDGMARDAALASLHDDPAWRPLVESIGLSAAPPLDSTRWVDSLPTETDRATLVRAKPDVMSVDSMILADGISYLRATRPRTNSVIILRDGRIVLEAYFNGLDERTRTNVKSASKAIVSAAVGAALSDGLLRSLDDPVAAYLPEYFEPDDQARRAITLRHLLTMTAGLEFDESGPEVLEWLRSPDWLAHYLGQDLVAEPGTTWEYATASTHLLGAALARAAGEPLGAYIDRRIFGPIGIVEAGWTSDPRGNTFAGSDLYLTPRDLARFGLLYLKRGEWAEGRVLPEAWIVESTTPQVADDTEPDLQDYGFGWWHWSSGRYRSFLAAGHGGQYVNVTPELGLVVVTTADVHRPRTPTITAFLEGYVFPSITRRPVGR